MKSILEFNNIEAKEFLLKQESYFNFDLPSYFKFDELLNDLSQEIEGNEIEEYYKNINPRNGKPLSPIPSELENVNYTLLNNKDGKFAWRPFQLIHPALYVALVHKLTLRRNWQVIIDRFKTFQENENIQCHSIPVDSETDLSDKSAAITIWWHEIEQKSLELALQYEFVLHTDVSNCYGSIYTHSISWALHTKPVAKQNRGRQYLGNVIDKYLRDMSYGQTNGIPQGSTLMDFIAEMVLGYIDLNLTDKIDNSGIEDYKILRYRDDYRIFTNNPQDAEEITKFLTEILIEQGMRLNAHKTIVSNAAIRDAISPDKRYWQSVKKGDKSLQGHLLLIHHLSELFPNSGSLSKALDKFFHRVSKIDETNDNITVLISILIDIAFRNPRTYPVVCGILSKLLALIDEEIEQNHILELINNRFDKIPNTGHIKIWLQRVTIKIDPTIEYEERLCQRVNDDTVEIWNSDWLNDDIKAIIDNAELIDEEIIEEIDKVIDEEEIQLFEY